jgi:hypothetical protein
VVRNAVDTLTDTATDPLPPREILVYRRVADGASMRRILDAEAACSGFPRRRCGASTSVPATW